uniref:Uncharacterized protein n=5 Tax=Aegilops tauschii subsp. strangulata TaxID=200361 RepID=A0A453BHQ0_AEGTS
PFSISWGMICIFYTNAPPHTSHDQKTTTRNVLTDALRQQRRTLQHQWFRQSKKLAHAYQTIAFNKCSQNAHHSNYARALHARPKKYSDTDNQQNQLFVCLRLHEMLPTSSSCEQVSLRSINTYTVRDRFFTSVIATLYSTCMPEVGKSPKPSSKRTAT